jgi:hypothetical protein
LTQSQGRKSRDYQIFKVSEDLLPYFFICVRLTHKG